MAHLSDDQLATCLAAADTNLDNALERLFALLRIPSISTDPAYIKDCTSAAQWLVDDLNGIGFDASLRPTSGHPMVVAHYGPDNADTPHVLFYGHYDVQPVDPLDLWDRAPFEPALETQADGHKVIRARGASDDKGQLMTFVEACRTIIGQTGTLPLRVTILFEGEEESGSPSLPEFLDTSGDEIKADYALVCDSDMWDTTTPSITTMLRGIVAQEIEISCADRDLHSGMYGNAARNPLQLLSELVASLRNPDGSVAINGFYDDVQELPKEIADMWDNLDFDAESYLSDVGLSVPAGETSRSVFEQITSRPTCEINGIWGGYVDEGFKTVIPAKAHAKISFRMVASQDPEKVRTAFQQHIRDRLPADASVIFKDHGANPATWFSPDSPRLKSAQRALEQEWDKPCLLVGTGGSIPIVGDFQSRLGMESLLIGFAQNNDNIHSPNEKYDLNSFHKGIRSWIRILSALAQ